MGLNTAASLSFSQINSTVFFTNGNLGVNTTSPAFNLDVSGTINVSGKSTLVNTSATNISSTNLVTSSITSGALHGRDIIGINISTGFMVATTITGANLSLSGDLIVGGTLTTVNITSTNISDTNISTGTLIGSGKSTLTNATATNISTGILIASTGITTGTINATGTSSLLNMTVTNTSTGTINASGTSTLLNTTATNISTGVLIASTGITSSNIRINNGTASSGLYMQGSGPDGPVMKLENITTGGVRYAVGSTHIGSGAGKGFSIFDQSNGASRLLVGSSGNIGFGTITPGYKLDVNGSINATISITTAALSATNISAGTVKTSGITVGSLLASSGITTGNIRLNDQAIYLRGGVDTNHGIQYNSTVDGPKIWGVGGGKLNVANTSTPTVQWNNSGNVGIGGITSLGNKLSINTTTDTMAINSDACNTLLVYEDMQGTTVRSGTLAGANVSYSQNNYVQLTPGSGAGEFGQWYWNMNPGNAFTTDYEVQVTGTADGHKFFWGSDAAPSTTEGYNGSPVGYSVFFDEYNGAIKLFYNGSELTAVYSLNLRNSNWVKIRIVYQRNVIKVYYSGVIYINYKDTARHLNYSNNYMGFTAVCGGQTSAHRIRQLRIQKFVEGLWNYTSQTSSDIMIAGGNVGINTSSPTQALDIGGNTMMRGYLYSTSVPNSTNYTPLPRAAANFAWNGSSMVVNNAYNCSITRIGTGGYRVTFTNGLNDYVMLTGFQRMATNDFLQAYDYGSNGFVFEFWSGGNITDNTNSMSFVVL